MCVLITILIRLHTHTLMHLLVQQLVVWSDQYCIDPKVITQHTAGYASRNTLCCIVSPIETPLSIFINILEIRLLFRKLHHLYRSHRCERFCTFSAPLKTKTSIFQTVGSAKETNTPSYQLWDISWGQCFLCSSTTNSLFVNQISAKYWTESFSGQLMLLFI